MKVRVQPLLLSISFFLYALAKLQTDLPQSILQALGMLFLCMAALRRWQPPPQEVLALLGVGIGLLCVGWAMTDGATMNVLNSLFVLLSFPIVMAASSGMSSESLLRNVLIIIICLCLLGVAQGEISVTYLGDIRGSRWTLGFQKPTFLAEAMTLFIVAAVGLASLGSSNRIVKTLLVFAALLVLVKTGSRAGLGASMIFLLMSWESHLPKIQRLLIRLGLITIVIVAALLLDGEGINQDVFNKFTTGRWDILRMEIGGNITQPMHWLVGNGAAKTIFEYGTERAGFVYHFDSFFGERFVVTGILGLIIVLLMVWSYARASSARGKAVISACLFYGLFENGVFNITSMFSTFMLLFAFTASRTQRPSAAFRRIKTKLGSPFGRRLVDDL